LIWITSHLFGAERKMEFTSKPTPVFVQDR